MKLNKLNLQGKIELLDEFELKGIKGGYTIESSCKGGSSSDPLKLVCSGSCFNHNNDYCQPRQIVQTWFCVCANTW